MKQNRPQLQKGSPPQSQNTLRVCVLDDSRHYQVDNQYWLSQYTGFQTYENYFTDHPKKSVLRYLYINFNRSVICLTAPVIL